MDLILDVKSIFELEGIVNTRICSVKFLNRSLPIFPIAHHKIKPERMACVKVRIPFVEKLSGVAVVKLLYKYTWSLLQNSPKPNLTQVPIISIILVLNIGGESVLVCSIIDVF